MTDLFLVEMICQPEMARLGYAVSGQDASALGMLLAESLAGWGDLHVSNDRSVLRPLLACYGVAMRRSSPSWQAGSSAMVKDPM